MSISPTSAPWIRDERSAVDRLSATTTTSAANSTIRISCALGAAVLAGEEHRQQDDRAEVGDRGGGDDELAELRARLAGVLEDRHDDAQRCRHERDGDQHRRVGQAAELHPVADEHAEHDARAEAQRRQAQAPAAQSAHVELEAGEKQQEGEAEQRDDLDGRVDLDPAQAVRPDEDPEPDLRHDRRHAQPGHEAERERRSERDRRDDEQVDEPELLHAPPSRAAAIALRAWRRPGKRLVTSARQHAATVRPHSTNVRVLDEHTLPIFDPDAALLAGLRAGDERAFVALIDRHGAALLRHARTFVQSTAVAEDVVQEAWLAVVTGVERFEGRSQLRTWLYGIVANRARTRAVRERRSVPFSSLAHGELPEEIAGADALPEDHVEAGETRALLDAAIDALPPAQREVVRLRDVEGWASGEVCSALGLSDGNQRVLLHRGRSRVRSALRRTLKSPHDPSEETTMATTTTPLTWHRVLGASELPEGRVTTVTAGHLNLALTHVEARTPRSTTTARTRAARSARGRSRTACCAAHGTAMTTAR